MGAPRSNRTLVFGIAAVVALAAGISARHLLAARLRPAVRPPAVRALPGEPDFVLHVPHMPGGIILDGDTDDPGWTGTPTPARTHAFLQPNGAPARPFSEIRVVWGDGYLYLSLYAADEDIESRTTEADGPVWLDDAFRVIFSRDDTEYAIEVSPRAVITDSIRHGSDGGWSKWDYTWSSGAHASKEMDGTLNAPNNMDEEWVIEMAVPFDSLGLEGRPGETLGFSASRCDTPKGSPRTCASWGDGMTRGSLLLE
jgi:hypothetical protein